MATPGQKWQTLGDWAKRHGLTYQAAWRQWQRGQLPVQARQLPTGTIVVRVDEDDGDGSEWQRLGVWAKRHGLTYRAAWRQWRQGQLPVQARQLPTGTIVVRVDEDDGDESEGIPSWQKLSVWAKRRGLTYRAAWRQWRQGQLPVQARQLPTGTIVVRVDEDDGDESEGIPSWQKLSVWAKRRGLTYRAAWRRWRRGRLPVQAQQLPSGTIVVRVDEKHDGPPASQRE